MEKTLKKEATFIELARRQQILDAALKLFAEKGFHQTSLAEIAGELGISKGVISYHFDGKADLGQEVIQYIVRMLSKYVQQRVSRKETGREKLLEFVDACIDYIGENRSSYLTYIDTMGCFGTVDEKREMMAWVNRNTREIIIGIIKSGRRDGSIGRVNAKNAADVLQGILDGMMEVIAAEPEVVNVNGCKRIIEQMITGLIRP